VRPGRNTKHCAGSLRVVPVIISVGVLSLIAPVLVGSRAAETVTPPDTITLSNYAGTEAPVTFSHKDHGSTGSEKPACAVCHHTTAWDQTPEKCSVCHKPLDASAAPTDIVAFHKLCIGCHKSEIERGDTRLSLACDSCHAPER
jgi:hypothetical protein